MNSGARIARRPVCNATITTWWRSASNTEMATELAELVVAGIKRATAGLVRQFGPDGEPPPVVGGYVVLLDGADRPRAVWRTIEVRIGPLNSVDERFAWDEGEGERTRAWWLSAHRRFFGRRAAAQAYRMHDEIETIFERFEIIWPPEIADISWTSGDTVEK